MDIKTRLTNTEINLVVREAIESLRSRGIKDWEILDSWSYMIKNRNNDKDNETFLALQEASHRIYMVDDD